MDNPTADSFINAAHTLAGGLFKSIVSARSHEDCRALGVAVNNLSNVLKTVHPDLPLELGHLSGFMEEKLGGPSHTTPKSAVEGQIKLGMTTIQNMLSIEDN